MKQIILTFQLQAKVVFECFYFKVYEGIWVSIWSLLNPSPWHISEINSISFYRPFLFHVDPRPSVPIYHPDIKLILSNLSLIPRLIQANPTTDLINRYFIEQTEVPKVEQNNPEIDWLPALCKIAMKMLSSALRSQLYLIVMLRVADENCTYCADR